MSTSRQPAMEQEAQGVDLAAHAAFGDLAAMSGAVLTHLQGVLRFRFWAVTRVTGGTSVVVCTGQAGFPVAPGAQLPWDDTLCRLVLQGRAPRITADVRGVPGLRDAPLVQQWQVGAYLSAPLTVDGIALAGTVCAMDSHRQPARVAAGVSLLDLQARWLSTVRAPELTVAAVRRRADRAAAAALLDPLTGLINRRGWEVLLVREEQRCRRYGTLASVLVLDLDGLKAVNDRAGHVAGDAVLRRAANVLRGAVRSTDVVARLAGLPQLVGTCGPSRAQTRWSRACGLVERPIPVGTRRGVSRSTRGGVTWSSSSRGPSMPPPTAA